jgi:hypothetical protein
MRALIQSRHCLLTCLFPSEVAHTLCSFACRQQLRELLGHGRLLRAIAAARHSLPVTLPLHFVAYISAAVVASFCPCR